MADSVTHRISPFCNLINLQRFDESTLRLLDVILSSRDVKLLSELRQKLTEFLRSQSLSSIRQSSHKPIDHKLLVLDFFVRAFAILSDSQSCLALRYEALVMRDSWTSAQPNLRVSCDEWMNFAQDAFDYGFYAVAAKACEKALSSFQVECNAGGEDLSHHQIEGHFYEIKRLRDDANILSASHPGPSFRVFEEKDFKPRIFSRPWSATYRKHVFPRWDQTAECS